MLIRARFIDLFTRSVGEGVHMWFERLYLSALFYSTLATTRGLDKAVGIRAHWQSASNN